MASRPQAARATGLPCADAARTDGYRRREPEKTVLYGIVRDQFATFLAEAGERYPSGSVPPFVEGEFRRYLDCGILARGFARVHCDACSHDLLVAFSCKGRGFCPSCATRRMSDAGAFLVAHVLPDVPMRQWVLSLPRRLRFRLA